MDEQGFLGELVDAAQEAGHIGWAEHLDGAHFVGQIKRPINGVHDLVGSGCG
jgi:hypothetical protein